MFRAVWDPKYDVLYCVVHVMGWQLELADDESGKICKVYIQDIKIAQSFRHGKVSSKSETCERLTLVFESKNLAGS